VNGRPIAIGTRGSALALAQARLVSDALEREGRRTRVVVVETEGDRRAPDTAWGEGAFVAAIEAALLDGRVDVAVHSAKDIPTEADPRLRIAAYLPRADPRDALVVRRDATARRLVDLPAGTRVGTDSPRRTGFVRALRPDLVVHPLHGNVDTRLRRLDDGETDALILACAGLDRLGREDRISERIAADAVPPAPGQGAIAAQIRSNDARMLGVLATVDDTRTRTAVEAERAFLTATGGGCRAPVGALATYDGAALELLVGHVEPDGSDRSIARRLGTPASAAAIAETLAAEVSGGGRTGRRPRVLVPRSAEQSGELADALSRLGLEPVVVPAIDIEPDPPGGPLDAALASIDRYRWVVVTSANGGRAVSAALERTAVDATRPRWAAIGPVTATVLQRAGIRVEFRPTRSDAGAIGEQLPIDQGDAVLLVRGNLADAGLPGLLRDRGALVDDVIAYRPKLGPEPSRQLLRDAIASGPIDAVLLTSGSTADGLIALAAGEGFDPRAIPAVCIGTETAHSAAAAGFRVAAVSPSRDVASLARATADVLAPQVMEVIDA
jgi:hydroxymethylbilane synthase